LNGEPYHPSLLRKLGTAAELPDGLLFRMSESAAYKASTISVYVFSVPSFRKFQLKMSEYLVGFCSVKEVNRYISYMASLRKSLHRKRTTEDHMRHAQAEGHLYGEMSVLVQFLYSDVACRIWKENET
jgi:hypothetical protein